MRGTVLALVLGLACAGTPVTPDAPLVYGGGTVALAGLVESEVEQKRAEEIARAADAGRVVDHLERSLSSGDGGRC